MAWIRKYKQKKLISKISVDSNFKFSSYARLCAFHCSHRLLCWIKSRVRDFSVKIALISYWNDISLIPLGEECFLEESYKNMQKIQIWKMLTAPSIQHQWVFNLNVFRHNFYSAKVLDQTNANIFLKSVFSELTPSCSSKYYLFKQ